jgi:acetolactate synthase-1/2/3 large subunit
MAVDTRTTADAARVSGIPGPRLAEARNGAEALIQLLVAHGVEYLFLCPGTDTAPVQEAIVRLGRDGHAVPKIVPGLYENVALAAAHGYFCVTRKPQAVLVHVDAGTQNLGAMLHDAQRAHGGVLIFAGRTPYTVDGTVAGGRDAYIQWLQDQPDQPGIVRNYVKWWHELGRTDTLNYLIPRAAQIAASEPCGPVYMTVAREVLMAPMEGVTIHPPERTRPALTGPGDLDGIEQIAEWLADAEHPLILAGDVVRHPEDVADLTALAETIGAVVNDRASPLNIALTHPQYRLDVAADVREADAILLLDNSVPWIPKQARPKPEARIAQIDIDPVKASIPLWGFPVDLPLVGDTSKALPLLLAGVERRATPERRANWSARRERLKAEAAQTRRETAARLDGMRARSPIHADRICAALGAALPADAIVIEEAVTNLPAVRKHVRREQPGTLISPQGPGLGWPLGGAVGVKLAAPDRVVVSVVGDGSFVFGSPVAALYAAQTANAPFLTVILNNRGYNASKSPVLSLFPDGASAQANAFPGVRFQGPPDYAALARSCHAYGERVEDPAEVEAAIGRALAAVAGGQSAVLDVIIDPI